MMKEVEYTKDLGERLAQKRDRMGFPRDVLFEITHRCNLRCRHCYVMPESGKRELTTFEVKSLFHQLVEVGCLHVTLTGGEPLVREDIFSLIDYGRRIGLFIHLFTNATLITPQIADRLKEFQLISLEISFHSLKKERFDWFTQVSGSFDKVMRAIELLRERKLKLSLKINITRANLDEIEDLQGFVKDLEAIPEWATILMPRSDGSKDNLTLRLEPEEVFKVSDMLFPELIDEGDPSLGKIQVDDKESSDISDNGSSLPVWQAGASLAHKEQLPGRAGGEATESSSTRNWVKGRLFQCGAGKKGLAISPYGELKPCLELPSSGYFILEGSLKEGWKMLGNYVESFKPSPENKCLDCKLRDFCSSCPAKARLECGDMNCCPDYYRRLAELSAQRALYSGID